MSKNLVIDIGNSCSKIVVFEGKVLKECWRTSDSPLPFVEEALSKHEIENCVLSCVGKSYPELDVAINCGSFCRVLRVNGITPSPLKISYKTPLTLGADRLAAVVGALSLVEKQNILVIDVGTCITYDLLTENAEYIGGSISPGVGMRFTALNEHTSRLPLVDKKGEFTERGIDTVTAIRSGVLKGIEYEISGWIDFAKSLFKDVEVVATGGGLSFLVKLLEKKNITIDEHLVARGLNEILLYNS